jgi:nucleoside-diphosphate-sugar epimerase
MMQNKTKNILTFGGTRYFGKRLVGELIEQGHAVTLATRGKAADPFGDRVKRLVLDRYNKQSLEKAFDKQTWDLVYDQICYAPSDAANVCDILANKVGRYIFTSSMSVYDSGLQRKETDFDPRHYAIQMGRRDDFSYPEGKRQAEAVFFQKADFPLVSVRFPIVLGPDDYTGRLSTPIRAIKNGQLLPVNNP